MTLESSIRGVLSEAKKIDVMQIHKVLAKTKNSREGIQALKKAFRVNDTEAKKLLNRAMNEEKDKNEYDQEGEMAKTQLRGVLKDAEHMIKMFGDEDNLPEWVQAKIIKAADYLKSAHNYMMNKDEEVKEEWVCGKCNCDPCTCEALEEKRGEGEADTHIIMQLRKAQDLNGNHMITFRGGKKAKVDKKHIDKILKLHNHPGMKPDDKRKLRVMISKSPADLAKLANQIKEDFQLEALEEKTLTPAEKKKREEVAKAIERDNPDMPMDKKMAIATATAKRTAEAYNEPQGQAKRMMSPLQKARMDKEKADRDRDGKLKAGIGAMKKAGNAKADAERGDMTKRMLSREKQKRQHDLATKSRQKGDHEMAKKHDDAARKLATEAAGQYKATSEKSKLKKGYRAHLVNPQGKTSYLGSTTYKTPAAAAGEARAYHDVYFNTPGRKANDRGAENAVADYRQKNKSKIVENMIDRIAESALRNRFGKGPVDPKKFDVYKKYMKTNKLDEPSVRYMLDNPNDAETKRIMKSNPKLAKAVSLRKDAIKETKGAPKGYHFTRDGKLKKGDAGQDGPGGKMLRSDPLDKQRKKIPPLPENDK